MKDATTRVNDRTRPIYKRLLEVFRELSTVVLVTVYLPKMQHW